MCATSALAELCEQHERNCNCTWDVNFVVFDILVEVRLDSITLAQMLVLGLQMSFVFVFCVRILGIFLCQLC